MGDYRQYVSFDVPADIYGPGRSDLALTGDLRRRVEQALREIASTPEGERMLREAARQSPDGKVNFLNNYDGFTLALRTGDIAIGANDSRLRYYSPETDRYHNLSIQRAVFHELAHIGLGHSRRRGDEGPGGISPSKETEAVRVTNAFMRKYYNEPARDEQHPDNIVLDGSAGWGVNPNFRNGGFRAEMEDPDMARQKFAGLTPEQAERLGPEARSLYELRNHPDLFENQLQELKEQGSLPRATADFLEVNPVDPKGVLADAGPPAPDPETTFADAGPRLPSGPSGTA